MRGLIFLLVYFLLTSLNCNARLSNFQNNEESEIKIASHTSQNEYLLKKELAAKNYPKALFYINEIIKERPYDCKFLRLGADIAARQNDFATAASFLERLKSINQSTVSVPAISNLENDKLLAYCYSKLQNYEKALQSINDALNINSSNSELLELAVEYAMAQKRWDIALDYVKKALALNPDSEKMLSIKNQLCSLTRNCPEEITTCQKLAEIYSRESCKFEPCDPCKIHKCLTESDGFMSRMYNLCPDDKAVLTDYADGVSAKEKNIEAYDLIKKGGLEETLEGLRTQGDIALLEDDFEKARGFYNAALKLDYGSDYIKSKIGTCYRKERKFKEAEKIYAEILQANPQSEYARIGMAYIDIDKCDYKKAEKEFAKILEENPNSKNAKIGMVYAYMGNNLKLKALELLKQMPEDDEVNYTKANLYYNMGMYSDAQDVLRGMVQRNAQNLKYEIKRAKAFTLTPSYTLFNQELSETYDLKLRKVGIGLSEYGVKNTKAFIDYGLYIYISGLHTEGHLTNVTNELRGGIQSRPTEKFEYRTDMGLKAFQFQGDMFIADNWIKHYVNDYFNYKIGFRRNNVEQSYLAAVGFPVNGIFTGRVADNRAYTEMEGRLPNKFYWFFRAGGGTFNGQNLPTNPYLDEAVGLGKIIYNEPKNKWIQFITLEAMNYNSSYQRNLLNISAPGVTSSGTVGGYFSPSFYIADTVSLKLEGAIKKWHLTYGFKGFVGGQAIFSPDFSSPVYGVFPFLSYNLNDHLGVNLSYSFSDYSGIQRHYAIVSVNIKFFTGKRPSKKKTS